MKKAKNALSFAKTLSGLYFQSLTHYVPPLAEVIGLTFGDFAWVFRNVGTQHFSSLSTDDREKKQKNIYITAEVLSDVALLLYSLPARHATKVNLVIDLWYE